MSTFTPFISRQIFQLQFRPTLRWFGSLSSSSSALEKRYQEWQSDKNGNVSLYSPEKKEALEVFSDRITYICESQKKSLSDLTMGSKDVLRLYEDSQKSDVSELRRLGSRVVVLLISKFSFSEITDLIASKIYNQDSVKQIQGGNIKDLSYVVDSVSDDMKTHIQMGAMKSTQAKEFFKRKFDHQKDIDSEYLFVDIDVSKKSNINVQEDSVLAIKKTVESITNITDYFS